MKTRPKEGNDICPQHILEHLNGPLSLPIYLQMIGVTKVKMGNQLLMEALPKPKGETNISV